MYTTLFWIIILIITCDYLLGVYLDYLNKKQSSKGIPEELNGLYDSEKVEQQKQYFAANYHFNQISNLFSFIVLLLMFFLFGFAFFDNLVRSFSDNTIVVALLFFGLLYIANDLITIPFSAYHTFKIEEKFGFNKMTPVLFFTDILKEWIMTALLGGVIISLLMLIYQYTGGYFWIIGWAFMSLLSIFMMMFYSNLIVPLFNKQTPLEEGELRNKIEDFCQKVGFELDNLFVIDGSKRTTKANAYFSGLGRKKRIVLYDTLIEKLTPEEIVAVLAHEIGHYKHKHTLMMLILSIINTSLMFYLLSIALGTPENGNLYIAEALGSSHPSFQFGVIVFGILYTPISTFLGIFINYISRKNEYQADDFAKNNGLGTPLGEALKKLSTSSLSNLNPHPKYVFFHYSHPTLLQRLENLKK